MKTLKAMKISRVDIWRCHFASSYIWNAPWKRYHCFHICMWTETHLSCAQYSILMDLFWTLVYVSSNMDVFLSLTAVDCGSLTDPVNGQVNHTNGTTFRQTATYSCDTGYNLMGKSTLTCQATGEWSGNTPTCQGMLLHSVYLCSFHERSEDSSVCFWPFCEHPLSNGANWWCQASKKKWSDWNRTNYTGSYSLVLLLWPLVNV